MLGDNDFHLSLSVKISLTNRDKINGVDIALAILPAQNKDKL